MNSSIMRTMAAATVSAVLLMAGPAGAGTLETDEYVLSFTETVSIGNDIGVVGISSYGGFGPPQSAFFRWALDKSAASIQFGAGVDTRTVLLPAFTLTAKTGYEFSNLGFSTAGTYTVLASELDSATGSVSFSGAISSPVSATMTDSLSVSAPPSSVGLWVVDVQQSVPTFTSLTFSGGNLMLSSTVGGSGAASMIVFDPSNAPGFSFQVAAVPEASEWAMMLAGLGVVGFVARRRRALGS